MAKIPRVDKVLSDAREIALATSRTDSSGIQDSFLLIQLNQAKLNLQTAITTVQAECWAKWKTYSAPNAAYITQPDDIFADQLIYDVQYSPTSDFGNYNVLEREHERGSEPAGEPYYYMLEGDKIYFDRTVNYGYIRVRYEAEIPNVDLRRGQVASLNSTGDVISSLVLADGSAGTLAPDDAMADSPEYICVCDYLGNIKIRNIPVESYDSTSRIVSVVSGWSADAGWSLPSPAIVVIGQDTSTHLPGPNIFRQYYLEYLRWEIEKARSSLDSQEANGKLSGILDGIVEIYDQLPSDRTMVPELRRG